MYFLQAESDIEEEMAAMGSADGDEEDDDEDVGPKVTCCHSQMLCLPYYIATWLEWHHPSGYNLMEWLPRVFRENAPSVRSV